MSSAYTTQKSDYQDLINEFGEDTISERIDGWKERINAFVDAKGLSEKVHISGRNLWLALLSYFDDIKRLKSYHGIKEVNGIKIHSYTAFWLLRKKPIQVLEDFEECERVNERFVSFILVDFLLQNWADATLSGEAQKQFIEFTHTLYYAFSYRDYSAQSIELVLTAFLAGIAVGENIPNPAKYYDD